MPASGAVLRRALPARRGSEAARRGIFAGFQRVRGSIAAVAMRVRLCSDSIGANIDLDQLLPQQGSASRPRSSSLVWIAL